MRTVLITGAGGFLAREIAQRFKQEGWVVLGTERSGKSVAGFDRVFPAALGDSIAEFLARESVDAVVHAANDNGASQYDVNVQGTLRWMKEAGAHSRPVQLFFSSLSAAAEKPTDYGRAKRDIESSFLDAGGVVVRLALVVGNGGLFGRMIDAVQRSRLLPLLDGGRAPVYAVNRGFLIDFVVRALSQGGTFTGRVWHVHQPTQHSLRDVMVLIRKHGHDRCRFVSIPSAAVLWPLLVVEHLTPFRLSVSSTNIRGLRVSPAGVESDFSMLGGVEAPLESLVAEAVKAGRTNP